MPEKEVRIQRNSRGSRSRGTLKKERGSPNRRTSSSPVRAGTGIARRDAQGIKSIHHFGKVDGVVKPVRTSRGVDPPYCKPRSEENMNTFQNGKVPIKMLIEEEMLIKTEPKHTSPGVIARLMGLDALPMSRPSYKNKKQSEMCCHETSHGGFGERGLSQENQSFSSKGQHEFKDVFEVLEISKVSKHQISPVQMSMRNPNQNKSDIDFIRQKFLEAKCFNDERHHNSKGFNHERYDLDSNKDILFKCLHEHNLPTKYFQDKSSVSSKQQSCNITLLKPTRCNKLENCISNSASDRENESHSVRSLHKYGSDLFGGSVKEKNFIGSHKFVSSNEEKKEQCSLPTRIVVLKPTIDTVQLSDNGLLPSCTDRRLFACKKQKQYRIPCTNKLFSDTRDRQRVQRDVVLSYLQTYKGASKSLRSAIRNDSVDVLTSECNQSARHGCPQKMQKKSAKLDDRSLRKHTSESSDDWDRYHISSSSPHSVESSLSGKERIRLSERWKISSRFRKDELAVEGANTLGGMLALSDKEIHCKPCKNNIHPRLDHPSGISSRDGWKDGHSRKLARSKSLPSSSTFNGISRRKKRAGSFGDEVSLIRKDVLNPSPSETPEVNIVYQEEASSQRAVKTYNNSSPPFESVIREENPVPIIEKYVKSVEQQTVCLIENRHELSEPSGNGCYDAMSVVDDITTSGIVGVDPPVRDATSNNQIMISKETSPQQLQVNVVSTPIDPVPLLHISSNSNINDGALPLISKDADHPSPISVLEPIDEEMKASPECFKKLNTDLQGLRLQLQLLRSESNFADAPGSEVCSDEETRGDDIILSPITEVLHLDANQRDFSYVHDMFTSVVLRDAAVDMVYMPEYSVGPDVFEKLEKVYKEPLSIWTKADRMLLFDFTNSVLTEVIRSHINLQPWVNPTRKLKSFQSLKVTVDEVWLVLVGHQNKLKNDCTELILESGWLELCDLIDLMGMEIQQILMGDLLDEIISEL